MSGRLATRLIQHWAGLYTLGLPEDLAQRRRAELESDLWEHESDWERRGRPHLAWHLIARCLLGVPADVSWRIEQIGARVQTTSETQGGQRQIMMPSTAAERGMLGLVLLLAGFFIVMGPVSVLTAGDDTWEPSTLERTLLGGVPIISGVLILSGLYLINQAPGLGAGLLVTGAIAMAVLWFWLFFLGIPVVIFMAWYARRRAREATSKRIPPGGAA